MVEYPMLRPHCASLAPSLALILGLMIAYPALAQTSPPDEESSTDKAAAPARDDATTMRSQNEQEDGTRAHSKDAQKEEEEDEEAARADADAKSAGGYRPQKSSSIGPLGLRPIEPLHADGVVVIVPLSDTVELGLSAFIKRALRSHPKANAIILEVDTFGGRVDAAVQMRDAILSLDVPVVAYVKPRAISAGALISLAADQLVMARGASIGAATPYAGGGSGAPEVDEKMTSYMRTEMRATAEARSRRGDIAEAMVDADVVIEGITQKGKLLTLDTDQAIEYGIADGRADTQKELLEALGLERFQIVYEEENWGEKVARFLTEPTMSSLLLSLGMLALFMTFYTQNFGVLTAIGMVALALFFGGHAAVELVGFEEALLLVAGVLLLAVELFILPGFILPGVAGVLLILAALVMAMLATPISISFSTGLIVTAIGRLATSILFAALMIVVAMRFLPRSRAAMRFVLQANTGLEEGYLSYRPIEESVIGAIAVAVTDLRPSGKVRIDGEIRDARSERSLIEAGSKVRILRIETYELIVREDNES